MMKKLVVVFVVLAAISVFGYTLFYLYGKTEEQPIVFETATPFVTTIVKKAVATGSVVPRREVEIKPQVSGIVQELFVEPGDDVEVDDLLARIRIIPDIAALSNAETRVNRARIELGSAELDLEQNRRLLEEGVISRTDYRDYELAYQTAQEELTAAIDNLQVIKQGTRAKAGDSTNTLVRATIAGMVLEVPLEEGDFVIESNTFNDGTTIAAIADMDELVFEGKVDESEVGKIRPGMDLLLTIGAVEERQFEARLEHISPKGVEENGAIQFELRAALEQQEDVFVRANYSANADIVLDRRDNVLAINESLLQFDDNGPYVEIEVAPQVFERRDVETGLSDGIAIEVLSGLDEQTRVKDPGSVR